jgi:hypothetical protein
MNSIKPIKLLKINIKPCAIGQLTPDDEQSDMQKFQVTINYRSKSPARKITNMGNYP